MAEGNLALIDHVANHIERFTGEAAFVVHEKPEASRLIHVDVHVVPPNPDGDGWVTLFTTGMSVRPMDTPPKWRAHCSHAELVMAIPAAWVDFTARTITPMWPVNLLRALARYPIRNATWIGINHTVPWDIDGVPWAGVGFTLTARFPKKEFAFVKRGEAASTILLAVVPLTADELREVQPKNLDGLPELAARIGDLEHRL